MIHGIKRKLFTIGPILFSVAVSVAARGQTLSLSGTVKDTAGHAVPSARVSAKSMITGKLYTAHTGVDGIYTIPELKTGDYKVWAKAGALSAQPVKVSLAAGQMTDLVVSPKVPFKKK